MHRSQDLRRHCGGLVLLGLLLLLVLAALGALMGGEVWATAVQREQEEQLLFVGEQYRRAIENYWRATPGRVKTLPSSLAVLLEDDRFPMPVRHLRRLYRDPFDAEADWGLVKIDNGIAGVYSASSAIPLKRRGFSNRYAQFEDATAYKQWRFVFQIPGRPSSLTDSHSPESQDRR
ncbi:MAG: type II secretion system protein [Burkholderiaceae bacterium]